MDSATPSPERLELSTMKLIPGGGGKIEHVTVKYVERKNVKRNSMDFFLKIYPY